jgi:formiminotetrahydrofolate cyclodeaminase
MATITFEQIAQRVADHRAAEAANATPLAVACRALDTLRESLALMSASERDEITDELAALVAEQDAVAWADFGAALVTQEG